MLCPTLSIKLTLVEQEWRILMRSSAGECTMQCMIEHEHQAGSEGTKKTGIRHYISISVEYKEVLILEILLLCTVLLVSCMCVRYGPEAFDLSWCQHEPGASRRKNHHITKELTKNPIFSSLVGEGRGRSVARS